jgi:hypothetical protein
LSRCEELTAISLLADQEAEAQKTALQQLNQEMEHSGETLEPLDYGNLRSRIEQQEMRAKAASRLACSRRIELGEARSKESVRLAREMAQHNYDAKLAELNAARAEVESKRRALSQLQREIPLAEQRANLLLFSLDQAKTALEREAVTA